jgi:tryptophanyl-tRNA synthetase
MVTDWLAAGLDPKQATIFLQSLVPEHAELHMYFSAVTRSAGSERVPTYKEQRENITDKDLGNYAFLGYPVLQAADICDVQGRLCSGRAGPGRARRADTRDNPAIQQFLR